MLALALFFGSPVRTLILHVWLLVDNITAMFEGYDSDSGS